MTIIYFQGPRELLGQSSVCLEDKQIRYGYAWRIAQGKELKFIAGILEMKLCSVTGSYKGRGKISSRGSLGNPPALWNRGGGL